MTDTAPIAASRAATHPGLLLPDTPEWNIQEAHSAVLRHGAAGGARLQSLDIEGATRAIAQAEAALSAAPAAAGAEALRQATNQLRTRVRHQTHASLPSRSTRRQTHRPSLANAVRGFRASGNARTLMRALNADTRAGRARLAQLPVADLRAQLRSAGASAGEIDVMAGRVQNTLALRFHSVAVSHARTALRDAAESFRQAAGGVGLPEMATRIASGDHRIVAQMRIAGVDVEGVQQQLDEGANAEALSFALRRPLREMANRLGELRTEVGQYNALSGAVYAQMPGAARAAVVELGLEPSVVEGRPDGSVLGDAIASAAHRAIQDRADARSWMTGALQGAALLGGLTAPITIAVEAVEATGAGQAAERMGLAAAAGMNTTAEAQEAAEFAEGRVRAAVLNSFVAVGVEGAAHVVGHAAHGALHGASEPLVEAGAAWMQGTADNAIHGAVHAVEHLYEHAVGHEGNGH